MSRRVTYVSATAQEVEPLIQHLQQHAEHKSFQTYVLHGLEIDVLISGIGILQTTYSLMDYLSHRHPDLWIQAGIGGAFDPTLMIGGTYQITSEMMVGFGAEDADGRILDPFELGWSDPNAFPFTEGRMTCPYLYTPPLPLVTGMTSLHAHGHEKSIIKIRGKEHGQIENMEGAAFFYISLIRKIPFLSIRSVSNYVTKRDKTSWKIKEAISALNTKLISGLEHANYNPDKLFRMDH